MNRNPPYPLPGLAAENPLESSLRRLMGRFAETGDRVDARAVAEQLQRILRSSPIRDNPGLRSFYNGKLRLWRLLAESEGHRGSGHGKGGQRINGPQERAVDGRDPIP